MGVLDEADYFNRATVSKDDFGHGIRDLVNAGLLSASADSFALTARGRELRDIVWRQYESKKRGNDPIALAEKRLTAIRCTAELGG